MSEPFFLTIQAAYQHQSGDTLSPLALGKKESLGLAKQIIRTNVVEHHDRPSLVSNIVIEVGAEIVEGIREPGSDLNSVELSRKFDSSRTPIREALMLLEKQALITIPPRRRPKVATIDRVQMREIYQLRGRLLELAAAHIAEHATEEDLERMRLLLSDMVRAQKDLRAFVWSNVAFHDHMTTIGGNRLAKSVVDSLLLRTLPLRRLSLSQPGRVSKSLDDHHRLVRAFEEHDVNLAPAIIRSNHTSALRSVEGASVANAPST